MIGDWKVARIRWQGGLGPEFGNRPARIRLAVVVHRPPNGMSPRNDRLVLRRLSWMPGIAVIAHARQGKKAQFNLPHRPPYRRETVGDASRCS